MLVVYLKLRTIQMLSLLTGAVFLSYSNTIVTKFYTPFLLHADISLCFDQVFKPC